MVWAVSLLSDELSPAVLTAVLLPDGIRSLSRVSNLAILIPKQSSTPVRDHTTLALKLFRGEPAISEFDWHFTSNHTSSKRVVRHTGSVLHAVLPALQPAHG